METVINHEINLISNVKKCDSISNGNLVEKDKEKINSRIVKGRQRSER